MSYNKLYYGSIVFDDIITPFGPNFRCPACSEKWNPEKEFKNSSQIKALSFNKEVVFVCPNCAAEITLYVAVYKDEDANAVICIARLPIPENWMVMWEI